MRLQTTAEISAAIKAARIALGWSQTELAERVDTTQAVISKIENQGDGRVSTLLRVLAALELQMIVLQQRDSCLWAKTKS
ncbi:MAG TPA: helix-turn-helix domain-containing protein [Pseudidiomarina sp.]|nr:helix-turn-helix domain-containing protein [Pseudidiomarina sp.]